MSGQLLNIKDVCELLKCSKSFAYKIARSGALRSGKIGKNWRFTRQAVNAWIDEHVN